MTAHKAHKGAHAKASGEESGTPGTPGTRVQSATAVAVAHQDLFVSGRRAGHARDATRRGALLAFHANFRFGWRSKCDLLRKVGLLHVSAPAADVCDDPAGFRCAPLVAPEGRP